MTTHKLVLLEYYRGIAALGVAAAHYFVMGGSAAAEFFSIVFVEMFFPLSGFVLAPQVVKVCREFRHFKVFLYRRWLRTLPTFFVALCGIIAVTRQVGSAWDVLKYLFFLNFFSESGYRHNDYYAVSWSLAVEEYYYLIFPVFLFLCKGSLLKKTLFFIFGSFLIKCCAAFFYDASFLRIATYMRLDAIAIGFAVRLLAMGDTMLGGRRLFWLLCGVLPSFLLACYWHYTARQTASLLFFLYTASVFFACTCLRVYRTEKSRGVRIAAARKIGLFLGKISYSAYLFHPLLLIIASKYGWGFMSYFPAVILFSYAVYRFFEEPILLHRPEYKSL